MSIRFTAAVAAMLILVACGGGPAATPPASLAPGQTPGAQATPSSEPTTAAPLPGESIDGDGVANALAALQALDSWTFAGRFWTKTLDGGLEQTLTGTERRKPDIAVAATHNQPAGGAGFRYIRIGDDIWTDVGTGQFFHSSAPDVPNLIEQYEPFYIAGLIGAASASSLEYEPVGAETVNGIPTAHYTLSAHDRENATQFFDIDPALWAGSVWIASEGGYLVALAWGPQSIETAQSSMGFRYDVLSVNCACPIEPPE